MKLLDCVRIPLTTLCLLAPLAISGCADDGGSDSANETETGDGDGDPGDGDGDPGDGDGDPGDGDGDPGDGDGDPGDGDGDPGDGDGEPGDGDGDGDPGDGDGDPGLDCDPFDAQGVGPCEAFFGYTWTGDDCVGVSGCDCVGTDCDQLYDDPEQCWDDHALCELGDPCEADQAVGVGPCDLFLGWAWDGDQCIGISGCECQGPDCGGLPIEQAQCEAAHADC